MFELGARLGPAYPEFVIHAVRIMGIERPEISNSPPPKKRRRLADETDFMEALPTPCFSRVLFNESAIFVDVISVAINHIDVRVLFEELLHSHQCILVVNVIRI